MQRPPGPHGSRARRPVWPIVVGASTIVGLLVGGIMSLDRHPGVPPPPPTGLTAAVRTCVPPACDVIVSTVTLGWTPPTDPSVTGIRVVRDGVGVGGNDLPAAATGFLDHDVMAGGHHDYVVVSVGPGGESSPSNGVGAQIPLPPLAAAQFRGLYDVTLVVRSATNLMSLSGIASPTPGEHRTSTWGFQPRCSANEGPCPTAWTGRSGVVRALGAAWSGRVLGPPGRCADGTREPSPIEIRLRPRAAAMITGDWIVIGFTAVYSVGFHCPGFLASRGTVDVTGHLR